MSRHSDDVFGEVRSLLMGVPEEQLFIKLCARWPDGNVPDAIVGYVKGVVSRWPQDVPCAVPPSWVARVERDEPCSGLAMCKTLKLGDIRDGFAPRIVLWAKRDELKGLQHLELSGRGKDGVPAAFFRAEHFARVERLIISVYGDMSKSMHQMLESPLCRGLRSFHLECARLDVEAQRVLVSAPQWARLHHLALRRNMAWRGEGLSEEALISLFARDDLLELSSLDLSGQVLTPAVCEALTAWVERARCVRALNLSECALSDEVAQVLATHRAFSTLSHLNVLYCGLSHHALRTLARSRTLYGLRELILSGNPFNVETMQVFAHSPTLVGLKTLELANCGLDAHGVELLAESMYTSQLERLVLSNNPLGDEAMIAVAVSEALEGLRELDVSGCGFGDEGVEALTQASFFDRLGELALHYNRFGERGRYALWVKGRAMTDHRVELRSMTLSGEAFETILDAEALDEIHVMSFIMVTCDEMFWATLTRSPRFRRLRELNLKHTLLNEEAVLSLMSWPALRRVERLSLRQAQLTEAGIRALCRSSNLGSLRELVLIEGEIDVESVEVLLEWEGLAQLRRLVLDGCQLREGHLERLLNPVLTPALEVLRCEVIHLEGSTHHVKELALARGVELHITRPRPRMDIFPMEISRGRFAQPQDDDEIF